MHQTIKVIITIANFSITEQIFSPFLLPQESPMPGNADLLPMTTNQFVCSRILHMHTLCVFFLAVLFHLSNDFEIHPCK